MDKVSHKGEHIAVIGGGSKHQLAIAEGVLHSLGSVASGKIVYCHLGASCLFQLFLKQLHCLFGVAVNRGIGDHNAIALHAVA